MLLSSIGEYQVNIKALFFQKVREINAILALPNRNKCGSDGDPKNIFSFDYLLPVRLCPAGSFFFLKSAGKIFELPSPGSDVSGSASDKAFVILIDSSQIFFSQAVQVLLIFAIFNGTATIRKHLSANI